VTVPRLCSPHRGPSTAAHRLAHPRMLPLACGRDHTRASTHSLARSRIQPITRALPPSIPQSLNPSIPHPLLHLINHSVTIPLIHPIPRRCRGRRDHLPPMLRAVLGRPRHRRARSRLHRPWPRTLHSLPRTGGTATLAHHPTAVKISHYTRLRARMPLF